MKWKELVGKSYDILEKEVTEEGNDRTRVLLVAIGICILDALSDIEQSIPREPFEVTDYRSDR